MDSNPNSTQVCRSLSYVHYGFPFANRIGNHLKHHGADAQDVKLEKHVRTLLDFGVTKLRGPGKFPICQYDNII